MSAAHANVDQGIERRKAIMKFIRAYRAEHGNSPSMQEIADGVGYSTKSSVGRHINILVEAGVLEHDPKKYRSMRPVIQKRKAKIAG